MSYDRQKQIREVHVQRRKATEEKANKAIDLLVQEKRPVNFKTVAKISGISTATLYNHKSIAERIKTERKTFYSHVEQFTIGKTKMSDESKDAIIASLKRKIARLEEENEQLKKINNERLAEEYKNI